MRGSSGGMVQLVLEGYIEGKKGRGRLRRIWGDDITEWSKGPFTLCNLYKTRNINVCQCLQMHSMTNLAVVNISYLKFSSNARGIIDSDHECAAAPAIAIAITCKKRKKRIINNVGKNGLIGSRTG